jgi:hypothetical protein
MNKIFRAVLIAATLMTIPVATPVLAQTPTVRVPMCLQVRDGAKSYLPCTGMVAVDPATGNALNWSDIFGSQGSINYVDRSVTALNASQAAGTTPVILANPARKAFAITPTNDGRLYIGTGASGFFYPLYAGVTRSFSGSDCPQNALYVTGQTIGTQLPMAEG